MTAPDTFDSTTEISDGRFHELIGPEPFPVFHDPGELEATWGRRWGAADEVGRLRSVLMRRPSLGLSRIRADAYNPELDALVDPDLRWYWTGSELPNLELVMQQYDALVAVLVENDVEVLFAPDLGPTYTKAIYTRDPLLTVPGGAIVNRLAPRVRRGEEQSIAATVAAAGMPILATLTGSAVAEGGSFLKVRPEVAFFGTSVRCNEAGYLQIREVLARQDITVHRVSLPGYLIHLDMCSVMLDDDLALINPRLAPYDLIAALRGLGVETVEVDQGEGWACNMLALNRRRVVMPDHFPRTAELLNKKHNVEIVPVGYREILKNGGGVHCSTIELQRDW